MKFVFLALCAAAAVVSTVFGDKNGLDVFSDPVITSDAVKCLRNKEAHNEDNTDYKFLTIRVGNSSGFMRSGLDSLLNARDHIDPISALIEICPKKFGQNTDSTVKDILTKIRDSDASNPLNTIQYVFMNALQNSDEDAEDCWYTGGSADDVERNIQSLQAGKNAIRGLGKYLGVKTNKQNWTLLTNNWNGIANDDGSWPLWWASVGQANFDGYESIGGWTKTPAMRQYQVGAIKCNTSVNLNIARDDFICGGFGAICDGEDACCNQWVCRDDGKCNAPPCKGQNVQCNSDNECCEGLDCDSDDGGPNVCG